PMKLKPPKVNLLLLHELIKHPDIEIKKRILQRIFDATLITEFTRHAIEKLKERVIKSSLAYRQAASEEVATLLLQDFQYGKNLIEELKKSNPPEWPWNVFDPIWRPNMATVIVDSHLLFNENLNIEDISSQIRAEMAKISELPIFWDWLLEECFFIPLDFPLNSWTFVEEFMKKMEISNKEALSLLKGWIHENNDPLAYLMGLEIVLNLRGRAEINEINEFKDKSFFAFLNRLFDVLLLKRSEDAELEKHLFENIKTRWRFRTIFNRYYLKYIDLNACKPMADDYKVILAWWMARELERVLIGNFSRLSLADQTQWLKENIDRVERAAANEIEHLMKHRKKELSVLRYHTLVNAPTLISLTLAIIDPEENQNQAFKGLKHPTNAFLPKFTNALIHALPGETLHGKENIISGQASKFHFLWELPFCISMPRFLKKYYGNHFELLGKEKVLVVKFAETISGRDFLKDNLPILPQMEDEKKKIYGPFLLSSLENYVQRMLSGRVDKTLQIFFNNFSA
ncbi:MAG TPA: hypothetical protein VK469_10040, partial [Candidatus Kapabacteria bacterium]|nr:hypothetical protein [Candidatus Kapabacteria bacterium]